MVLTESELRQVTGKIKRYAQRRVLNALGIRHKPRPDGSIIVLASEVERALGGKIPKPSKEPNWRALESRA